MYCSLTIGYFKKKKTNVRTNSTRGLRVPIRELYTTDACVKKKHVTSVQEEFPPPTHLSQSRNFQHDVTTQHLVAMQTRLRSELIH